MELSSGLLVRIVVLGIVAAIVQIVAVAQITIFGISPDLMPLIVVSVGLLAGSVPGAVMGFLLGLVLDLALLQTLGVSSLVYLLVGYAAGRVREVRDPTISLLPLIAGAGATAAAILGFALLQFLLGVTVGINAVLVQQIFIAILLNAVLALPVYLCVQKVLRSSIPNARSRRSRGYQNGGISPLK